MRLAVSSFSRILCCLWVGSPAMRVRVPCGIWARTEVSDDKKLAIMDGL